MQPAIEIPEKLFFKIGEVAEIVQEEQHVLRYWETEFAMLTPQKNRAGQRTYRRKDVEMAIRIKELLRNEGFTIEGARKKLSSEIRSGAKLKVVTPEMASQIEEELQNQKPAMEAAPADNRQLINKLRQELESLRDLLRTDPQPK